MIRLESMRGKTFFEILTDQLRRELKEEIRADLKAELRREIAQAIQTHTAPIANPPSNTEAWLQTHLQPHLFRNLGRTNYNDYSSNTVSSKKQSAKHKQIESTSTNANSIEKRASTLNIEQLFAREFFVREGADLREDFSSSELKTCFRTLALKLHPDRNLQAAAVEQQELAARFQQLAESFELLQAAL